MTDPTAPNPPPADNPPPPEPPPVHEDESHTDRGWLDDAEQALDRVTKALGAAWEATREARMSALESAKTAAKQLGEAIDRGAEAARLRWQQNQTQEPPPPPDTSE
ncbi:MAG TPA: hypothetical protein VJR05_04925 [Acidimicrobiia bacterium]|nr:hypothetical protein [Acidimicrobiia bacterium]